LFGLGKLAFNDGNCDDEVLVSSSWEGQTYIVDQKGSSAVIFTLDQEISAFSSGFYSVGNKKMPVLVYATFTGMIYLYYNISDYHDRQIRHLVFHPHGKQMAPAARNLVSDLLYNHQNYAKAKINDS